MTDPPDVAPDSALPDERRGVAYGAASYLLWGAFPLYFHALRSSSALEILAHRIAWTVGFCLLLVYVTHDIGWVRPLLRRRRLVLGIGAASTFIAVNWLVYVAAVTAGHVTDTALGYFLNPLVTVGLGVVLLRESLRPLQWLAVAIAGTGAAYLTIAGRAVPVIALTLAVSFALYGLIKKRLGASLPAVHGLTMETAFLLPVAAGLLVWLGVTGRSTYVGQGLWHTVLLTAAGIATAIPLLFFAAAARRVPLVTMGLLQFLAPGVQLLIGVVVLHEDMTPVRWIGFAVVWVALAVLTVDAVRAARRRS